MSNDLVIKDSIPLSAVDIKNQVNIIQSLMKNVMQQNEHYGVIPGCKKPSLWKSGAEKILFTFRLAASYEEINAIENDNMISYRIKCTLINIKTGEFYGSGNGACNSKEKKYATKTVAFNKATDFEKENALREEERSYNNRTYTVIVLKQDPWELQNTIYKMACKRALLAATLNATAASDIFTQDLDEDFTPTNMDAAPPLQEPKKVNPAQNEGKKTCAPTEKQLKRLFAISNNSNWKEEDIKEYYKKQFNIESSKELNIEQYNEICDYIQKNPLNNNETENEYSF